MRPEQILLRLQAIQLPPWSATWSARAGSRARSAASWPRRARDAADRRDRCRRRARSPPQVAGALAAWASASVSALPCRLGVRVRRGDAHQALAQLVEARRRDLVEHLAAALLPLFGDRLAHARDARAARRCLLPSSSASNNNVTSSSRTGPSARVMRRTRLSARSSASASARAPSTGSASRRRRDATRAWCTDNSSPACAAGMAFSSETSRCRRSATERAECSMLG